MHAAKGFPKVVAALKYPCAFQPFLFGTAFRAVPCMISFCLACLCFNAAMACFGANYIVYNLEWLSLLLLRLIHIQSAVKHSEPHPM